MNKLLLIMTVLLLSCSAKHRPYLVYTSYGSGWDVSGTTVRCDSVKVFDPRHAQVYIDGTATDLYADRILITDN
jgi:SPX domain protein involved in polyphosphate accumulation